MSVYPKYITRGDNIVIHTKVCNHSVICLPVKVSLLSLIHISAPTRLGMISYAVFCLKKKNIFRKPTVERRNIFKTYIGSWYFTDTGEFTPLVVNELVRKLESETGKDLEGCLNV